MMHELLVAYWVDMLELLCKMRKTEARLMDCASLVRIQTLGPVKVGEFVSFMR